jgi:biotin-dependent carboxylase-like uncharacterized protein
VKVGLEVLDPGPLTTVQDLGRPGLASYGVGPSGAADRSSARRANALVRNPPSAALLEVTLGGLRLVAREAAEVAVAGAPVTLAVDGVEVRTGSVVRLAAGSTLWLGRPAAGVRTYLAVRGGVDVPPVLGSRSTDLLSGLGPAPVRRGDVVPVGDLAPVDGAVPDVHVVEGDVVLPLLPGPRLELFAADTFARLLAAPYAVTPASNRVALRLDGAPLRRTAGGELASEGLVRGAVQVPPGGQPVLFLADHPVTGGYPVVAVVPDAASDLAAQARPGSRITFRAGDASH